MPDVAPDPVPPVRPAARSRVRLWARAMWAMPVLLAAAGLYLAKTPFDEARTLRQGTPALARVEGTVTTGRKEVSYDALELVIPRAPGDSFRTTLPVPHSLYDLLADQPTVPVRVLPGSAQPVVIEGTMVKAADGTRTPLALGRTQRLIAAVSSAISLAGALLLAWGVWGWNRYLARYGDPGERAVRGIRVVPAA